MFDSIKFYKAYLLCRVMFAYHMLNATNQHFDISILFESMVGIMQGTYTLSTLKKIAQIFKLFVPILISITNNENCQEII